ncbi:hypothetical protein [Amnibacterium kyonggiense]|nr:hypothetical protein [Amnibacterium kyonggiense]
MTPSLERLATRAGLALLSWGGRLRDRPAPAIDLHRVERPTALQRPFC